MVLCPAAMLARKPSPRRWRSTTQAGPGRIPADRADAARAVRDVSNAHPALRDVLQFNLPPAGLLGIGLGGGGAAGLLGSHESPPMRAPGRFA